MKTEHFDIFEVDATGSQSLPFVGEGIPAGFPSPATDYIGDRIDLNEVLIHNPGATYYARVRDYFMLEEELEQGDGILFDTGLAPRTGDLALCEYVEKRDNGEIWLMPGNRDYEPILITEDNERLIWGIVTHSIRQLRIKKGDKK